MKHVYIASPYTGQELAGVYRQIGLASQLVDAGFVPHWPLCSHFVNVSYPKPYETWIKIDLEILSRCDIMLRLPLESNGADIEEEFAIKNGIPVYYDIEKLIKESKE